MVEISNQQHAEATRLLAYFAGENADNTRGREARRKASLLAKALRKKKADPAGRDADEVFDRLVKEYCYHNDVCCAEYLAWKKVPAGLSFEDAFNLYVLMMKTIEGDEFFRIAEGNKETL